MLISAGLVVTSARAVAPGWVLVEGDRIADVQEGLPPRPPDLELPNATIVPGYVDAHAHSGRGGRPSCASAMRSPSTRTHPGATARAEVTTRPAEMSMLSRSCPPRQGSPRPGPHG